MSGYLEVAIEKLVTGGDGLARHEGQAVFVPLTAPGDRVRVAVKERRKGFVRATVDEILEPGPGRQDPPCPHYGQCGGCDLQHLDSREPAPGQGRHRGRLFPAPGQDGCFRPA